MRNRLGRLETNILDRLIEYGYDAMIVGGAVRDWLMDKEPLDIDIVTNAPYEKLIEIMYDLGELKFAGKSFGVLLVGGVEVATYRNEVCKDNIVLKLDTASNALEDSKRRDFTINSIYYEYKENPNEDRVLDFHNGSEDIREALIKAVGDPYERFNEDYSRILRAIHLAANMDFEISFLTGKAISELNYLVCKIPASLQGKIIKKSIQSGSFHNFLVLLEEFDLLDYMFPEISHTIGLEQNSKYHVSDVWEHTLNVVKEAESLYAGDVAFVMGAFLHDVAKGLDGVRGVNKEGQPNDIGHEDAGVPIAKKICQRLELGKEITKEVLMYVKFHGVRMAATEKSIKRFLFTFKSNAKHFLVLYTRFQKLIDFIECDAKAFEKSFGDEIRKTLERIRIISSNVFTRQIFYSNQFNFSASVITQHPNVKSSEIKEWIEFFIRNNIVEEEDVLKILNKKN